MKTIKNVADVKSLDIIAAFKQAKKVYYDTVEEVCGSIAAYNTPKQSNKIDEEASSYFFTDENLKNEFNFYKSDKLAGFEANGKQIKLAYFAKYNAIATYERNKLNNIVFYMSAWQPETVREMFESRLKNKVFNLYQVNGVKVVKIY